MSPKAPQPGLLGPGAAGIDIGQEHCLDITARQNPQYPSAAPKLRPYQSDVIARIWARIEAAQRRILLVSPTGSGKTVIAGSVVADAAARGLRVLFLAHRRELISQASRKLHDVGIDAGIILPGYPMRLSEPVQVASIASLHARAIRSSAIELPAADLIIVDEAHHCRARTWKRILEAYPNAIVVGLTATPCRGDGRGLGNVFEVLIECPSVGDLIATGYLVGATIYAPSRPDLVGVGTARGDYIERQLAERMDKPSLVGDIVSHWHRLAEHRRTVVFATSVAHAKHLADEFRRSGVMAEFLHGGTPADERDAILAGLAAGTVEVVCNCAVLTEGFDCPDVGCLVLARPTKSLGLFRQMIGRGLRPAPGKADCLILDHAGAVYQHGLPDDPIEWTLAEDKRAENRAHAARGAYGAPALVDCPECRAIRFQGQPCPACGWRPRPKAAAVDVIDGELGRVERNRTVAPQVLDQQRFYGQLLYIANERGYQRGWAGHKFREKFGVWPSWRYAEPVPADDAVRAWVRSRQIAYAKAQAKAATA